MSIRKFFPHLLFTLTTLPSCTTESTSGDSTHDEADGGDKSEPVENGRDAGSTNDDSEEPADSDGGSSAPEDGTDDAGDTSENSDENDDSTDPDDADSPVEGGDAGTPDDSDVSEPESDAGEPSESGAATSFFLPTNEPNNTVAPRIEIDARGGIHTVYPAYAGGGAYYSYCAENCDDTDAFTVVHFPSDETVVNAMIALSSEGEPRLVLSMFTKTVFATCDQDCTSIDSWSTGEILNHEGDKEVSGEAFALDPEGNPHFISHTYRAYLGIGQKEQLTHHHACNAGDCTVAENWSAGEIASQTWEESQLEFAQDGTMHLAFVAIVEATEAAPSSRIAAYGSCKGTCNTADDWLTAGLAVAYTDDLEAFSLTSSIALALTQAGRPRLLTLAKSADNEKNLTYFECDEGCTGDGGGWVGSMLSSSSDANVGLDLALDAQDRPRFVQTLNYNIAYAYCDTLPCNDPEAEWDMGWVELSSNIPKDDIILFPNCTVAAWFLHSPSLVLDDAGNPYVGYQARDVSGGVSNPDPFEQDCLAGTDMTLTRMTKMVLQ
jgi:hypothetical protein